MKHEAPIRGDPPEGEIAMDITKNNVENTLYVVNTQQMYAELN